MADGFNLQVSIDIFPEVLLQVADPQVESIARRVLIRAIEKIAPKGYEGHHMAGRHEVRPNLLRESGRVESFAKGGWQIIFESPSAEVHHNGAPRHVMPGKNRDSRPPFYVRTGPGGYTFGPTRGPIDHPGSAANPYLTKAAEEDESLRSSGALRRGPSRLATQFRSKGFFK